MLEGRQAGLACLTQDLERRCPWVDAHPQRHHGAEAADQVGDARQVPTRDWCTQNHVQRARPARDEHRHGGVEQHEQRHAVVARQCAQAGQQFFGDPGVHGAERMRPEIRGPGRHQLGGVVEVREDASPAVDRSRVEGAGALPVRIVSVGVGERWKPDLGAGR